MIVTSEGGNKTLSCFSETRDNNHSHAAGEEACAQERTVTSSCTGNQSLAPPPPTPPPTHTLNQRTGNNWSWTPEPFQKEGSAVQEDRVLKPITTNHRGPRSSNENEPPALPHTWSPPTSKPFVQSGEQDGPGAPLGWCLLHQQTFPCSTL